MKLFLILFPLALFAADVTDLGLLTKNLLIPMDRCGRYGTNFVWFEVEAIQYRASGTNKFSFKTTNEFLVLGDFVTASIPDGPTRLFIRQRCGDGSVSPFEEVFITIDRHPPSKPRFGKPVQIIGAQTEQSVDDILKAKAGVEMLAPTPPSPPGMAAPVSPVPLRYRGEPLPGGSIDRRRSQ